MAKTAPASKCRSSGDRNLNRGSVFIEISLMNVFVCCIVRRDVFIKLPCGDIYSNAIVIIFI